MAEEPDPTTVAIAVSGTRSRRAIRWAAVNLIPHASRVLLLHVVPPLPAGDERLTQIRMMLMPFKTLCQTRGEVEIVVLVGDNTAVEILRYMFGAGVKNLVLGASTFSWFSRTIKGMDVPSTVLNSAPDYWNVFLVSRWKLVFKLANQPTDWDIDPDDQVRKMKLRMFTQRERCRIFDGKVSRRNSMPSNTNDNNFGVSVRSDLSGLGSIRSMSSDVSMNDHQDSELPTVTSPNLEEQIHSNINNNRLAPRLRALSLDVIPSLEIARHKGNDLEEVKKLKVEVMNTRAKYELACKDLVHTKKKTQAVYAAYSEEVQKVQLALAREEILNQVVAEEKARHLEAIRENDEAKQILAEAAIDRHRAEIRALNMSSERLKIVDALFSSDKKCRRYSCDEIMVATDNLSNAKKIGSGGYGNVYRGNLDHTHVAIKVLHQDALEKKEQFIREVEVLTRLHHPHIVLLLGVCPEMNCLVYEYMENGSLEDQIFFKDGMKPVPWHTRFRIIFEVACGLAFLHGSKPDSIIHRDMKPGNILLDKNYVSKISDVGLAKLMSNVVPDSITEYRETLLAGTVSYMDPEYQRTGTVRPKSDLYAFGIIVLQILTARRPLGLLVAVENAISNHTFIDILDTSITGWPIMETEKLALLALRCSSLRCRDRPDLETEVLPEIEKILEVFDSRRKLNKLCISAPDHFFCPILQEIMEDPYIAEDGFTYEYRAIKAWFARFARHDTSPVTGLQLEHTNILPNLSLRSGILEWKFQMEL